MTSWQLYWLTRLDGLQGLACGLIPLGIVGMIAGLAWANGFPNTFRYEPKKTWLMKLSGALLLIAACIGVFLPSTKEMAAIILLPKITNAVAANEELKKLPNKLLTLANEWIEELKPSKEKE